MKYEEHEIEDHLREMLRPVEPRRQAAAKILAEVRRRELARERASSYWRWGAVAAALIFAVALAWTLRPKQDDRAARLAAQQFEMALRISSRKVAQLEEKLVVRVNSGVDLGMNRSAREN